MCRQGSPKTHRYHQEQQDISDGHFLMDKNLHLYVHFKGADKTTF